MKKPRKRLPKGSAKSRWFDAVKSERVTFRNARLLKKAPEDLVDFVKEMTVSSQLHRNVTFLGEVDVENRAAVVASLNRLLGKTHRSAIGSEGAFENDMSSVGLGFTKVGRRSIIFVSGIREIGKSSVLARTLVPTHMTAPMIARTMRLLDEAGIGSVEPTEENQVFTLMREHGSRNQRSGRFLNAGPIGPKRPPRVKPKPRPDIEEIPRSGSK